MELKLKFLFFDIPIVLLYKLIIVATLFLFIKITLFIIFFLIFLVILIFEYIYTKKFLKVTLKFLDEGLEIIKGKKNTYIKYSEIDLISINNNIFGSKDICINFPVRADNIFMSFMLRAYFPIHKKYLCGYKIIILPNLIDSETIISEINNRCKINLKNEKKFDINSYVSLGEFLGSYIFYILFITIVYIIEHNYSLYYLLFFLIVYVVKIKISKLHIEYNENILKIKSKISENIFINSFKIINDEEIEINLKYKEIVMLKKSIFKGNFYFPKILKK